MLIVNLLNKHRDDQTKAVVDIGNGEAIEIFYLDKRGKRGVIGINAPDRFKVSRVQVDEAKIPVPKEEVVKLPKNRLQSLLNDMIKSVKVD